MTAWNFIAGVTDETTDSAPGYFDVWTHEETPVAAGQLLMITMHIDVWGALDSPGLAVAAYHLGLDTNPDSGAILTYNGVAFTGSGLFDGLASLVAAPPVWGALTLAANGLDFTVETFSGDPAAPGATPLASAAGSTSTALVGPSRYQRFWPSDGSHLNMTATVEDGFGFYHGTPSGPPPPPPPPAPTPTIGAGDTTVGLVRMGGTF